jgi:hypothetical protein
LIPKPTLVIDRVGFFFFWIAVKDGASQYPRHAFHLRSKASVPGIAEADDQKIGSIGLHA